MPHAQNDRISPRLLLVGGARPVSLSVDMLELALAQAHARGLPTHVTGRAEALAATERALAAADAVSVVDHTAPGATAAWALTRVAAGERFDAVFALQEMAQVAVAETAEAIGAPGNPPGAIRRIRTKDACRRALAAAGFAQPRVRLCSTAADAEAFVRDTAGPWVVKPRDAMGSIGVSLLSGPDGLPAALELLPDARPFLVEEYVDGDEYSVEGVLLDGVARVLAITEKEKATPPHFVEVGHVLPAELPHAARDEINRQVTAALSTLGLRTGAFHVELWLTAEGVVLGEVHGRYGGDWIHRMLAYAVPGLEVYGLLYDDMLARTAHTACTTHTARTARGGGAAAGSGAPLEATRGAAVRYFTPPPGRLVAVEGWEEVRAQPDVLHAELTVAPGEVIHPLRRSGDRAGFVLVGAPDATQARLRARQLVESVRFLTTP
ncbi:ATP-grasp domain-containing protein [Streptomyces gilvosporeus]|uniref:Carboxylate--amine ligase n=1 Tax=Streptomyces gilvosporeus TaxID=553510 RepID=A0A1V0TU97_9ACTN|nr:ATP-grasp domain-containing protein [Streptomyces gilvosporeus]ARF56535.1 carboxylate--amine ligase [Streptomyces gilvosporeus]